MRMGNYLGGRGVPLSRMAAKQPAFGVRHPTVVPTNFTAPDEEDEESSERAR
jgi:hypothetical protein